MKKFYAPEINIEMYDVEDIITASSADPTLNTVTSGKEAILNAGDTDLALAGIEW